jgi:hypothetical protein
MFVKIYLIFHKFILFLFKLLCLVNEFKKFFSTIEIGLNYSFIKSNQVISVFRDL